MHSLTIGLMTTGDTQGDEPASKHTHVRRSAPARSAP